MRKKITLLSVALLAFTGCSMKNETVRIPHEENISVKDIEIYQDIESASCSIERYKEDAKKNLQRTFNRIQKNQERYEDRLDNGEDRFSKILKSYRKKKNES